jgi:hypothetical protein
VIATARGAAPRLGALALRLELPVVALWLVLGNVLSRVTGRVTDWYVMTDELLYERLGISIATSGSPLPRVRGALIPNVSQLYPLLIAPLYRSGLVPTALHDAHVLNAYVMTSASVPVYLLARKVTGRRASAYLVAVLSVCIPWIVFSSFLLTEVVAYPACMWCVLALDRATTAPRLRNDVLAVLGLGLATLARTQLLVLALVLPVAILLHEWAFAGDGAALTWKERARVAARSAVAKHRLLTAVYAAGGVAVVALAAAGRLASSLGTYSIAAEGNPFPHHTVPFFAAHVAGIALGLGLLPFVVGVAWLLAGVARPAGREAHAFAAVGTLTVLALTLEVTSFDLRFGGGIVRDRYLFYVVPVVLIGFAAALGDARRPRWSLVVPVAVAVYGFHELPLVPHPTLDIDTPVSDLANWLLGTAHSLAMAQGLLIAALLAAVALYVNALLFLRRRFVTGLLVAFVCLTLPAQTVYAFTRLFRVDGTAGRPLTLQQGGVFDWVDHIVGRHAKVTMVPFPVNPGQYWAGVAYWWDLEFWNRSVVRAAYYPGEYGWTPSTFPQIDLHFDPETGRANVSPSPYVVESDQETRFRISGPPASNPEDYDTRGSLLIAAAMPWHADWLTFGLTDDGWTKPGVTARIRVYSYAGQRHAVLRRLALGVIAPGGVDARPFRIDSNRARIRAVANGGDRVLSYLNVCVPAHGHADIRVSAAGASQAGYGDPASLLTSSTPREVGVRMTEIALANEIGAACRP